MCLCVNRFECLCEFLMQATYYYMIPHPPIPPATFSLKKNTPTQLVARFPDLGPEVSMLCDRAGVELPRPGVATGAGAAASRSMASGSVRSSVTGSVSGARRHDPAATPAGKGGDGASVASSGTSTLRGVPMTPVGPGTVRGGPERTAADAVAAHMARAARPAAVVPGTTTVGGGVGPLAAGARGTVVPVARPPSAMSNASSARSGASSATLTARSAVVSLGPGPRAAAPLAPVVAAVGVAARVKPTTPAAGSKPGTPAARSTTTTPAAGARRPAF